MGSRSPPDPLKPVSGLDHAAWGNLGGVLLWGTRPMPRRGANQGRPRSHMPPRRPNESRLGRCSARPPLPCGLGEYAASASHLRVLPLASDPIGTWHDAHLCALRAEGIVIGRLGGDCDDSFGIQS